MQKSFVSLPLLDESIAAFRREVGPFTSRTALVCVQHLLETTGSLLEATLDLGFRPGAIFVLGKLYSTNTDVSTRLSALGINVISSQLPEWKGGFRESFREDCVRLWKHVALYCSDNAIERIVILDDGGHCLETAPVALTREYPTIGIEQTTSGVAIADQVALPVIQVATSAAKRVLEPHLIAHAVIARIQHLRSLSASRSLRCGVVGLGQIGNAIAHSLGAAGHSVVGFDSRLDVDTITPTCATLNELILQSAFIFGCTGDDIFSGYDWSVSSSGKKQLISCSSEDREFRTLLRRSRQSVTSLEALLSTTVLDDNDVQWEILRGGFPVNFDGSTESVPSHDIQLTRFLLFAAIAETFKVDAREVRDGRAIALAPEIQRFGALRWLQLSPERAAKIRADERLGFQDLDWIAARSGGARTECTWFDGSMPV